MKKNRITKDGVTKASLRAKVHAIERDIIIFLTSRTVQAALKSDFKTVED